jgi:hypothetical protein
MSGCWYDGAGASCEQAAALQLSQLARCFAKAHAVTFTNDYRSGGNCGIRKRTAKRAEA